MNKTNNLKNNLLEKLNLYSSYFLSILYIEIIYLMILLSMIIGKTFAISIGFSLGILLSIEIVLLFQNNSFAKKTATLLLDFHLAISISFLILCFFKKEIPFIPDIILIFVRLISAIIEPPLIYILSSKKKSPVIKA